MQSDRRRYQIRMAKRKYKHGNWRQIVVDCGGMCIKCHKIEGLEFHEPFGEDKIGWGIFQARVLLCQKCHSAEHYADFRNRYVTESLLSDDVSVEILSHGGYYRWVRDFKLQDTFGRMILFENGDDKQ